MLTITPIPAFSDNYIWAIQSANTSQVVLVDPGQATPALKYIEKNQLQLSCILITHQHYDHTGGVAELLKAFPQAAVIGPNRLPSDTPLRIDLPITELFTRTVVNGDRVELPDLNVKFNVMEIPGHTLDHLAFFNDELAFCGDTLFGAGCGRLFSGTAQMMTESFKKLAGLPEQTRLYCAHEYTVDNLGFAKWVEPDNGDVQSRDQVELAKQKTGQATIPTTVLSERNTNPFMRFNEAQVIKAASDYAEKTLTEDWQVFAALREWKDTRYD